MNFAHWRAEPVALLLLHVGDLPDLEAIFGGAAGKMAADLFLDELRQLAGLTGMALRTGRRTFVVLKPARQGDELLAQLRGRLGRACSVEFTCQGEDIILVPQVEARTLAQGESLEQCYRSLRRAVASSEYLEQLRCDYLRRERERHSTLMGLPRELSPDGQTADWICGTAPGRTVPMQLGSR